MKTKTIIIIFLILCAGLVLIIIKSKNCHKNTNSKAKTILYDSSISKKTSIQRNDLAYSVSNEVRRHISFEGKLPNSEIAIIENSKVQSYVSTYFTVNKGLNIIALEFRHLTDTIFLRMNAFKGINMLTYHNPNAFFYLNKQLIVVYSDLKKYDSKDSVFVNKLVYNAKEMLNTKEMLRERQWEPKVRVLVATKDSIYLAKYPNRINMGDRTEVKIKLDPPKNTQLK